MLTVEALSLCLANKIDTSRAGISVVLHIDLLIKFILLLSNDPDTKPKNVTLCHILNAVLKTERLVRYCDAWLKTDLTSLPRNAAVRNADGRQEVVFYSRGSPTNSHCADVLCWLWLLQSIQPRNHPEFYRLLFTKGENARSCGKMPPQPSFAVRRRGVG